MREAAAFRCFPRNWPALARPATQEICKTAFCPFRKSHPDVLVIQPSQDRNGDNGADLAWLI
jgi:hypothetical protein